MTKNGEMVVALLGEPNVGKSSLLNALVGETVAITTDLAGTTRGQIRGYLGNIEIIDTPGMLSSHVTKDNLAKHMRKSISAAVAEADLLLYVLDAVNFTDGDIEKIANYRDKKPVIVAVNKADKTNFEKLYPRLAKLNTLGFVRAIVPVSAKTGFNINVLTQAIIPTPSSLRDATPSFDEGELFTDQSVRAMCQEIIRKALIENLRAEIPHGVAVLITKFQETQKAIEIHADIICQKPSHKPIIIGSGGGMLKRIGTQARAEIEKLLDTPAKLYTHVIVREGWKNDKDLIARLT